MLKGLHISQRKSEIIFARIPLNIRPIPHIPRSKRPYLTTLGKQVTKQLAN
jgi:hypothetical protein